MQAKFATVNGVRLSYGESAPNGPALVLLTGYPSRWENAGLLTADLARDYHVFCPSMRGMGLSARAATYRVADFVSDVAAFIRHVAGPPVLAVGHSGGGLWGLAAAAKDPSLVRAFVCLDVPLDPEAHVAYHGPGRPVVVGMAGAMRSAASVDDLARRLASVPLPSGGLLGDRAPAGELRKRAESLARTDPAVFDAWVRDDLRGLLCVPELTDLPGSFRGPVQFVYGDTAAGSMADAGARRYNHERYPWAQAVEMPGMNHHLGLYDEPAALTSVIRPFLKPVEAQGGPQGGATS